MKTNDKISLSVILKRFRLKISITFLLVVVESIINLLFPLFMGFAMNDLLNSEYSGLI